MKLLLLMVLILLNGMFAMAEIALVVARKNRLINSSREGSKSADAAIRLGENPTNFLSTIQIGITAIGILNGIVGQSVLAEPLAEWLKVLGLGMKSSTMAATAIVVITVTYLTIVIGELVPKRIAQLNAENIAKLTARPISALSTLSRPLVFILSVSTNGILRLMGKNKTSETGLMEEDIHAMVSKGSEIGLLKKQEHEVVKNVFKLDERNVESMMTPRNEIIYIDLDEPVKQSLERITETDHSKFPVCRGGMHNILGFISSKNLLKQQIKGDFGNVQDYLQPCIFVPETLNGIKLMEQLRESGVQMIFVVDEYGGISGIITLQDLLEAMTGEFKPSDPKDSWAVKRKDGSWLLDGMIPIQVLSEKLDLQNEPGNRKENFNTLSGMMMWLVGKIPKIGDIAEWEGWEFEVVDLDGNRVNKVLAGKIDNNK